MQIHLVIPGLIWPGASLVAPAAGIELPALARLLGLGRREHRDFEPLDLQLARLFGIDAGSSDGALPLAALRRLGESAPVAPAPNGDWLCADPVNLSFAREHLLLNDFPVDELGDDEVCGLIAALNDNFGDLGRFEACTPTRWYLRLAAPTRAKLFPLHDVIGRPVRQFLPEGEDARLWQRTMNEVQVLLHNHPLNQAREAAGRRPANSLWFWGAGALENSRAAMLPAVQAAEPLARGMARAAGAEVAAPDLAAALRGDTLVVLDALLHPARQLDLDSWRSHLAALERDWIAPLAAALRDGRVQKLTLTAPGDRGTFELVVRTGERWKFWRKPLAFDALLKSLTPAPPSLPVEPPADPVRSAR